MEAQDYILAAMHDYLYCKLEQMQEEKAKSTRVPNMVTREELFASVDKDIRKVLNKMFVEKRLKVHPTKDAPIQDFIELVKEK